MGSRCYSVLYDYWALSISRRNFAGNIRQEIVNDPADIPSDVSPLLVDLLERLLCKDPRDRITLEATAAHPWVAGDEGPVPEYMCRCGFGRRKRNGSQEAVQ
ncbi:unnamed protein product [Triticum turgidum subsp. durum]|uniref:Protein kinase domain-containing protein n=1 Tax=Triticum turgidum subsp. durum TaxID=4567 RepID=A0A9R0SUC3_TRITD|nr:unnamed protein product [Triticum turgidum subsp. durum]